MKINMKNVRAVLVIFLSLTVQLMAAQNGNHLKLDKITFLDRQVKEGRVISISGNTVKFTHKGESLVYDFDKKEIETIAFASGRIDTLTYLAKEVNNKPVVDTDNKVAVVPLSYIGEGSASRMDQMEFRLQEIAIDYLRKYSRELKIQDATETNAILGKKGINSYSIRNYTPKELAEILQVEYVIMGTIEQNYADISTVTTNNRTGSTQIEQRGNGISVKDRQNSTGFSNTHQNVQTNVRIAVYNEKGENIYSKSKHSILSTNEAYKNSLQFLLKRTPLYKR